MSRNSKFALVLLFFLTAFTFIYEPIIRDGKVLEYDDATLVNPLFQVHSVADYGALLDKNLIVDLEPVRDFSYWLDIQIANLFQPSWSVFHFTNLILWFGVCFLMWQLLLELKVAPAFALALVALYAFDPIFTNSVAWISGRKYMLSTLFIFAATLLFLRTLRTAWSVRRVSFILVLYFLACYSHPISTTWPAFAALYYGITIKKWPRSVAPWFLAAGLAVIGLSCAWSNHSYYLGSYVASAGVEKVISAGDNFAGSVVLMLGRFFFQIIFPAWPSIWSHYPGSPQNLVGAGLFAVFITYLVRRNRRDSLVWIGFFLIMTFLVVFIPNNVFAADAYITAAAFGIVAAGALLVKNVRWSTLSKTIRWSILSLLSLAMIGFISLSREQALAWRTIDSLMERAYEIEPTLSNTVAWGQILLRRKDYDRALEIALRAASWNAGYSAKRGLIFAQSVNLNPHLTNAAKIRLLNENPIDSIWVHLIRATLYDAESQYDDAILALNEYSEGDHRSAHEARSDAEVVAAQFIKICRHASANSVTKPIRPCDSWLELLKKEIAPGQWREEKFNP